MSRIDARDVSAGHNRQRLRLASLALAMLPFTAQISLAQQAAISPELTARMAKEKEARRACKVEICTAFAKPTPGAPIACEVTKTWAQPEILERIVGGSYVWSYAHVQCTLKLNLDREQMGPALSEPKATLRLPEHALTCNVDDKDPAKGVAFSVKVAMTPVVNFENGEAKSATIEPVKTEGSSVASAAVASLMAVDKVSGMVSKAVVSEVNDFLFSKCKDDGIEIKRK